MTGKPCKTCKQGVYIETSLFDDIDGVLHCSACNAEIRRYEDAPEHYIVCADGACKANGKQGGGRGGWGAVITLKDGTAVTEVSGGERATTNNKMELTAVIEALSRLPRDSRVEVYTDSQYVVKGMREWLTGWKKRNWTKADGTAVLNADLWQKLDSLASMLNVSWHWVKGHAGHPGNERADTLASDAAKNLLLNYI